MGFFVLYYNLKKNLCNSWRAPCLNYFAITIHERIETTTSLEERLNSLNIKKILRTFHEKTTGIDAQVFKPSMSKSDLRPRQKFYRSEISRSTEFPNYLN